MINEIVCASVPNDRWGELESGQTTIAFTRLHQHETDELTGSVQTPSSPQRQPIEVCFAYADVDAAYKVRLGIIWISYTSLVHAVCVITIINATLVKFRGQWRTVRCRWASRRIKNGDRKWRMFVILTASLWEWGATYKHRNKGNGWMPYRENKS